MSDTLLHILSERIAILDGAMGTMIQGYRLEEEDFRGQAFADHPHDLKGNNDILSITRPDVIREIHLAFLQAGAELLTTNTFNANRISQADYHLESAVYDLNVASARLAREAIEQFHVEHPDRPAFVCGALGPTNRTASMSPDVNNPGFRAVTFNDLVAAYHEQAVGLMDGGVDVMLIETIFDTLNAKAAIFACHQLFEERGQKLPIMLSVTITDASGRNLSGQTVEAFWNSVAHAKPLSVGINCALGAKEMRPYIEELARIVPCYVSCHPNAGLPNEFGGYDDAPADMADMLETFVEPGWVNIVGGCCGTTPDHIAAIAERVRDFAPRSRPDIPNRMRLSGLEPLSVGA